MIRFSDLSGGESPRSLPPDPVLHPANSEAVEELYRRACETVAAAFEELGRQQLIDLPRIEQLALDLVEEFAADDRAGLRLVSQAYDPHQYLQRHSANVFLLVVKLARALEVGSEVLRQVGAGALLHDAGMLWVPEEVRDKPGRLSPSEERLVHTHPDRGREAIVEVVRPPALVATIVAQEHEQPDGRGYPHQLSREEIDPFARLVRVADFFEAYTHPRSYRPRGFPPTEALRAIVRAAGGAFDPEMARLVLRELTIYPVGSVVELSTGEAAEVVATNSDHILKPVVLVVRDAQGLPLAEPRLVDLAERPSLYIRGLGASDAPPSGVAG